MCLDNPVVVLPNLGGQCLFGLGQLLLETADIRFQRITFRDHTLLELFEFFLVGLVVRGFLQIGETLLGLVGLQNGLFEIDHGDAALGRCECGQQCQHEAGDDSFKRCRHGYLRFSKCE